MKVNLIKAGILFLLMGMLCPVHAQGKSELEGTWVLESVELTKKENEKFRAVLSEFKKNRNVSSYSSLTFSGENCIAETGSSNRITNKYNLSNDKLTLYFNPLAEEFEVEKSNDILILKRIFSDVDDKNPLDVSDYKVVLTYKLK